MKKVFLMLLVSLLVLFSGCGAMDEMGDPDPIYCEEYPEDPDCQIDPFTDMIQFSGNQFNFVDLEPLDIYKDFISFEEDFMYLYTVELGYSLTLQEQESLSILLPKITALYEVGYQINGIMELSLSDFKTTLEANSIEVTTEDIFTFNLFKQIRPNLEGQLYEIDKTEFLEYKLNRALTNDEITGLELLQTYFVSVNEDTVLFDLETDTFEELKIYIELDVILTETEYQLIEEALLLIQSLYHE